MSGLDSEKPLDHGEKKRREAADWILLQDRGFTPEEQDAFSLWLAEDPLHSELYKQRVQLWKRIGVLRQASGSSTMKGETRSIKSRGIKRARNAYAWIATAACLTLGAFGWLAWKNTGEKDALAIVRHVASEGYERHTLEDGSLVELNSGAAVSIQYNQRARVIVQESGEAHFTVTKDANRPFLVYAGRTLVRAVGTAFNVHLDADSIEVLVTEGKVELSSSQREETRRTGQEPETFFIKLEQGQRSSVPTMRQGIKPGREEVSTAELEKRLEWKSPLIQFTTQPLRRVIAEFNRYNDIQIELSDPALGERTITAALRMNNLEGFIQLLEAGMRIQADRRNSAQIVLRSGDAN